LRINNFCYCDNTVSHIYHESTWYYAHLNSITSFHPTRKREKSTLAIVSYSRIVVWGGGIFAPAVTVWFRTLERLPIKSKWPATFARVGLDQFVFAPIVLTGEFRSLYFATLQSGECEMFLLYFLSVCHDDWTHFSCWSIYIGTEPPI